MNFAGSDVFYVKFMVTHVYNVVGRAHVAQLVEHVLGKDGVTSSTLVVGSTDVGEEVR